MRLKLALVHVSVCLFTLSNMNISSTSRSVVNKFVGSITGERDLLHKVLLVL